MEGECWRTTQEQRGVYAERSLWSGTGWCAREMRKRRGGQMQVCRKGQASIVLLFGFHSVHWSVTLRASPAAQLGLSQPWQHQVAERERSGNVVGV